MSGPALATLDSHHAIHQAAFDEAERLTRLLRQTLLAGQRDPALQLAAVLVEHWQTRTLRHADAEEAGWYRAIVAALPERQPDILALTRDHDLLRILLAEIQGILTQHGITAGIVERFEAMLLLNAIHSREEERRLLGRDERADGDISAGDTPIPAAAPLPPSAETAPTGAVPLAMARPALYTQLIAHLRARGLGPDDLLAAIHASANGPPLLRVACGPTFSDTREWALPDEQATSTALETLITQIGAWCEPLVKADYQQRMRLPSNIQPNTRFP